MANLDLSGCAFVDANLSNANLSSTNLSNAVLKKCNLSNADLSSINLSNADLSNANLNGANLRGANLNSCKLENSNLIESDLFGANLSNANLTGADLSGAKLTNAKLNGTVLDKSNLKGVNLSNCDLSKRDMSNYDLSGANLADANLSGAKLSNADISGVITTGVKLYPNLGVDLDLCVEKWCQESGLRVKSQLYRATVDGFDASTFHSKCNSKGPTLTVITSNNGYKFGGYTSQSWDSSNQWKSDNNAWLFSVNRNTKIPIDNANAQHAIYCHQSYGPTFGGGHDLHICNSANQNNSSYSGLGSSYKHPSFQNGQENAQTFLAGSYNFTVSEIIVYQM